MFSLALRHLPTVGVMSPGRSVLPVVDRSVSVAVLHQFLNGSEEENRRSTRSISTSSALSMPYEKKSGPKAWPRYNRVVFPPTPLEEKQRPAYVCHMKTNIKYSPWKMWYIASLIRGMQIDEALRQLDYIHKKGAHFVKETLLEAQELAVRDHNVEFRSNLWVAESFCSKGVVIRGIRRHAKARVGLVEYFHCHYFVRLEEGPPPKHYYEPLPDGPTLLQRWINDRRDQQIVGAV